MCGTRTGTDRRRPWTSPSVGCGRSSRAWVSRIAWLPFEAWGSASKAAPTMRERLTLAFVVLTILLLLGAGIIRSYVLRDLIREQESQHLSQEVTLISSIVEDRTDAGAT